MASVAVANRAVVVAAPTGSFERFAGACGVLAGASGLLYAISFVVLKDPLLSGLFLMLGGLFTTSVVVALYQRLRDRDMAFALWGTLLAFAGALGAAVHGGYDLAYLLHPVASSPYGDLPSPMDPRGLVTFGVAGAGILTLAWLMGRDPAFPKALGYLGLFFGVLQVALYLGRLIVLDAASPLILVPAIVAGFVVNPVWYIWLGLTLLRGTGEA